MYNVLIKYVIIYEFATTQITMNTPIMRISPQGHLVLFILFSSITIILGFIVYALLCSSKFRRPQFREGRKISKMSSLFIVAPLVGVLLWCIYSESWGYFFTIESNVKTINIGYYYPERKVTLNKTDIVAIHVTSYIRKDGIRYRLVIRIEDGDEYISQLISQRNIGSVITMLEKELKIKIRT